VKFIHAADLHLDSPLRGLERYEGAPVERIRGATRRALDNLVELAIDEHAAFILLAGDVFDGDWRDYKTGLYFASRMARLGEAGIPVFIVRGNHDAANVSLKRLTLPDNVREMSSRTVESVPIEDLGVVIHGRSYRSRREEEDLASGYPDPVPGLLNIGLLHTSLDGRPGHDDYAPTTRETLTAKGYDYWALGHVHAREVVSGCDAGGTPTGEPWIVFPGNPQGRHVKETGSKGCTVVTVDGGVVTAVEHRDLSVLRWAQCTVDATGATDADEAVARLLLALEDEVGRAAGLPVAARCTLAGACDAHHELVADRERWVSEVRARAFGLAGGEVWIESVRFATRAAIDLDAAIAGEDALGELLRLIRDTAEDDERMLELAGALADLDKKLPPELARGDDPLRLDDPGVLRAALAEARDLLVTRLTESGGGS
jgi:hypothetical protein